MVSLLLCYTFRVAQTCFFTAHRTWARWWLMKTVWTVCSVKLLVHMTKLKNTSLLLRFWVLIIFSGFLYVIFFIVFGLWYYQILDNYCPIKFFSKRGAGRWLSKKSWFSPLVRTGYHLWVSPRNLQFSFYTLRTMDCVSSQRPTHVMWPCVCLCTSCIKTSERKWSQGFCSLQLLVLPDFVWFFSLYFTLNCFLIMLFWLTYHWFKEKSFMFNFSLHKQFCCCCIYWKYGQIVKTDFKDET